MKVLMIGGTGTISYDASKLFIEKGHDLYLLNRGIRNNFEPGSVHYLLGDVLDAERLNELLKNEFFDVIVDFLMFNPEQMEKRLQIISDKCKQYVFISSATAYQNTNDIITEKVPLLNSKWGYAHGKAECERYLISNIDKFGFYYTIVRPYYTYDHRRLFFPLINDRTSRGYYTLIHRLQSHKPVIICGDENRECRFNLTSSKDMAVALEGLLLNPNAVNEDFHITSDYVTTWKEILGVIEEKIGVKCESIDIPASFLEMNYPEGKEEIANGLAFDHIFDNNKIHCAVPNYNSLVSVKEGLSESIDYLLKTKDNYQIDEEWNCMEDVVIHLYEEARGGG